MRLPPEVIIKLRKLEWDNLPNLRARLRNERPFPIRVPLGALDPGSSSSEVDKFHAFQRAWENFEYGKVIWENRNFRSAGSQPVPTHLEIEAFSELARILGDEAVAALNQWEEILAPALKDKPSLIDALISLIPFDPIMTPAVMANAVSVVAQLHEGMGRGFYSRGLPINGVDTKFLEVNERLVTVILDDLNDGRVTGAGGLFPWLGCESAPSGWITIRSLCDEITESLGGHSVMQLPPKSVRLLNIAPTHLLVVENLQSLFVPDSLIGTVAIGGCGANLAWMTDCSWAERAAVGYWGDIDSWGFKLLSDARISLPQIESLLMDERALTKHLGFGVSEGTSTFSEMPGLKDNEFEFVKLLRSGNWGHTRLEQERLHVDYVRSALVEWHAERNSVMAAGI